jgi:hypothetical protein
MMNNYNNNHINKNFNKNIIHVREKLWAILKMRSKQ